MAVCRGSLARWGLSGASVVLHDPRSPASHGNHDALPTCKHAPPRLQLGGSRRAVRPPTCELVELEDGVFELRDVAQGGRDGPEDGVVGDVKVLQVLGVANGGGDGPRQLVVVHGQHLQLGGWGHHVGDGPGEVVVACTAHLTLSMP